MAAYDLTNISQVQMTSSVDEVNVNLKNGWKLLLAYTYAPNSDFPNNLCAVYTLGWPTELGKPSFIRYLSGYWAPDPEITD